MARSQWERADEWRKLHRWIVKPLLSGGGTMLFKRFVYSRPDIATPFTIKQDIDRS